MGLGKGGVVLGSDFRAGGERRERRRNEVEVSD